MKQKILVVSDSHGNQTKLNMIVKEERPFQYLVHCGDGVADLFHVDIPKGVIVLRVTGNVDLGRELQFERELVQKIEGHRVLVIHGDRHRVNNGYEELAREGERQEADIIFFGHTHQQYLRHGSPVLFNPGTVSRGLYGVVEIENVPGKEVQFFHRRIEE
ncbi:MAG: YfcE family phosphodiesterase [bacterium]|nr:YfcE family phosphodiesterase [bacterium]